MKKQLKILPDGTVRVPNELIESDTIVPGKRMSNYIDFQANGLNERKLFLQARDFKIKGRDNMLDFMTCSGNNPHTLNGNAYSPSGSKNILGISEYVNTTSETYTMRVTSYYKFKLNSKNIADCDKTMDFCLYCQDPNNITPGHYGWYNYKTVLNFKDIEVNKVYEGYVTGEIAVPTSYTQINPFILLNIPSSDEGYDLDFYDFTVEVDLVENTKINQLRYQVSEILITGFPENGQYDISKLKIQRYDNTYIKPTDVILEINGEDYSSLLDERSSKVFKTDTTTLIKIKFKNTETIINMYMKHLKNDYYSEQVLGVSPDKVYNFQLYFSYFLDEFQGTKKFFPDYYRQGYIDLKLQDNFSENGLQFTMDSIITNLFKPLNPSHISFSPDFNSITNNYVTDFTPVAPQALTSRSEVVTGYGEKTINYSAWVRVSKDCNSDTVPTLCIKDSNETNNFGANLATVSYDMSKKGTWQLLCITKRAKELKAQSIRCTFNMSKTSWTKGLIQVKCMQLVNNINNSDVPNQICNNTNAYVELIPGVVNDKSLYLEFYKTKTYTSSSQILWFNVNNKNLDFHITMDQGLVFNYAGKAYKTHLNMNKDELVKLLINKNGDIYINGKKETNIPNYGHILTSQLGAPYIQQFTGVYKKLLTFYDALTEKEACKLTRIKNPSIPLNNTRYEEREKLLNDNKVEYYFPLTEDYYDSTNSVILPCTSVENNKENIKYGIGHVTSVSNSRPNYFGDKEIEYTHNGALHPEEELLLPNCKENNITISGYIDIATPELITDDDEIFIRLKNGQDHVYDRIKLKNRTFFKLSEYNVSSTRDYALVIKSKATIVLRNLVAKDNAGVMRTNNNYNNILQIKLQKLIDPSDSFTIIFETKGILPLNFNNGYMINSLGSYNSNNKNYVWFGKNSGDVNYNCGTVNFTCIHHWSKSNNSLYDWINDKYFRVIVTHDKLEKKIHIKYIRLNDMVLFGDTIYSYSNDKLDFTINSPDDYTLFLGGYGQNASGISCNAIISNLHIIQKCMTIEEINKYLAPMSIGRDYVRAGFEFSELNNI